MARFSTHQADAWVRRLEGEMRRAAERGLLAAAHRLKQHIVAVVIPAEERPPVDEGGYRAGWAVRKVPGGAMVYNASPQAAVIEDGARAGNIKVGRKMIDALTAWVVRKGIGNRTPSGARRKKALGPGQARGIAWAIAMSMKRRGIFNGGKGLRILAKAGRMAPRFIDEEVRRELARLR